MTMKRVIEQMTDVYMVLSSRNVLHMAGGDDNVVS